MDPNDKKAVQGEALHDNRDDVDPGIAPHSNQMQDNMSVGGKPKASEADADAAQTSQKNPFQVDREQLRMVPLSQQATELQTLGLTVYNQQEFEEGMHMPLL